MQQPGYQQPGSYPGYPPQNQGAGGYPQPNAGYPQSNPYPNPGAYPSQPPNMYPSVPNAAPYGNPAPSCELFLVCTMFFFLFLL